MAADTKANKGKIVNVLKAEKSNQTYCYELKAFPLRCILDCLTGWKKIEGTCTLHCQGCLNMIRLIAIYFQVLEKETRG